MSKKKKNGKTNPVVSNNDERKELEINFRDILNKSIVSNRSRNVSGDDENSTVSFHSTLPGSTTISVHEHVRGYIAHII